MSNQEHQELLDSFYEQFLKRFEMHFELPIDFPILTNQEIRRAVFVAAQEAKQLTRLAPKTKSNKKDSNGK